jgi:hypothetical protein
MTIYVGIDDTNNSDSVGTAKYARSIAKEISKKYPIYGVTRHQFYLHPAIKFSIHNFCAVIHVDVNEEELVDDILEIVKKRMHTDFNEGSNPGLAVAHENQISPAVVAYGKDAKEKVLTQDRAWNLARNSCIKLEGFGQTKNGVIGAIAGIGLAITGNDGRFIQIGKVRTIKEPQQVKMLLSAGVEKIFTVDGSPVTEGIIFNEDNKPVKPSPVNGEVILFVEEKNGIFTAVNKD